VNRKWLVGGVAAFLALVAVLALVLGGVVGRSIVPSPAPKAPSATVTFTDTLTDVSISYPATWERRFPRDQQVRLVAASRDASEAVSLSVRRSGLETVTADTLPIVRPLTDDLLRADDRIGSLPTPDAVTLGGLPGYRYAYTYRKRGGGDGAHVHYFLFKQDRLVQIVLQADPAGTLTGASATFERVAHSFRATRR
jgi:hypothetical protein